MSSRTGSGFHSQVMSVGYGILNRLRHLELGWTVFIGGQSGTKEPSRSENVLETRLAVRH